MPLTRKSYTLNNVSFEAWFYQIGAVIWIKAKDVCDFLGYKNTKQAILKNVTNSNWKKTYAELQTDDSWGSLADTPLSTPENWQENTLFVNEQAIYQLICRSKKNEAVKFFEWLCDKVLPTLRETGSYSLAPKVENEEDKDYKRLAEGLVRACDALALANHRMYVLAKDAIHKPSNPNLMNTMSVLEVGPQELVSLRTQKRNFRQAKKRVLKKYPKAKEIYTKNVPHANLAWNKFKDEVRLVDPRATTKANTITLETLQPSDVPPMLTSILDSKVKVKSIKYTF
jgi:prophage antirepressor-like protein